jgi:hypothetical protein
MSERRLDGDFMRDDLSLSRVRENQQTLIKWYTSSDRLRTGVDQLYRVEIKSILRPRRLAG